MSYLFQICCALSVGIVFGICGGAVKMAARNRSRRVRPYSAEQIARTARIVRVCGAVLKFVTITFLALGLVWCAYYLVLGACEPAQAEYATAMSQLIVSVLTIVSIGFAFFEFLRSSRQRGEAEAPRAVLAAEAAGSAGSVHAAGVADTASSAEAAGLAKTAGSAGSAGAAYAKEAAGATEAAKEGEGRS